MSKETVGGISFEAVKNDINGNPRYVCHFLNLLTEQEIESTPIIMRYATALKRANKIGGRKYHNKQHAGEIVFQSYSLPDLVETIKRSLK